MKTGCSASFISFSGEVPLGGHVVKAITMMGR